MKFILVDAAAAIVMIQDRTLQSLDFSAAAILFDAISNHGVSQFSAHVQAVMHAGGLYLLAGESDPDDCLIFDLQQCNPFDRDTASDGLLVLQRMLRLAIKIWGNLRLSGSEHIVDSHKVALFPFNFASRSLFRLTVERVDETRARKSAGFTGRHMLVFKWGRSEGEGRKEKPNLENFNLALNSLKSARVEVRSILPVAKPTNVSVLGVTMLDDSVATKIPTSMPLDAWKHYLTRQQMEFVSRSVQGPEKIEGPAGTGKTLCLVLKCINTLSRARDEQRHHHALFITHSMATKRAIEQAFTASCEDGSFQVERGSARQSVTITTLQDWCASELGRGIGEAEFLDRDAMESKELQLLYISEALSEARANDLESHRPFLSAAFADFLTKEDLWCLAEMFQHEIAVVVKGRAGESLERYKELPPIKYNLPLNTADDRGFVFVVYQRYQRRLAESAQFDTDDITLSAMAQLDTPIWRRRRSREGYDSIFVDETHLFNINELSVIHFLSTDSTLSPICFSVDRSQAVGDRGLDGTVLARGILAGSGDAMPATTKMKSIFRCSPEIVSLAFTVTSAGATLFTTFENPLELAASAFTAVDEEKCSPPIYVTSPNDDTLVRDALAQAEKMEKSLNTGRSSIAIVLFSRELFSKIERVAREGNRPVELLKQRGDVEVVNRARVRGRFVVAAPEYIGGLEFDGVVLVGVDKGRVPPKDGGAAVESRHFLKFASHNHLYVSITRARYQIALMGTAERGPSELLEAAFVANILVHEGSVGVSASVKR